MSEILTEVSRGPLVESYHRGDVVLVKRSGEILASVGNPHKVTYIRSAGKPLQALNVFLSGAAERYGFTDAEISIMCASHYGEDFHRATIDGILKKLGLPMGALHCGSTYSIKGEYAREQVAGHVQLLPSNNDCSGKHTGMLASCLMKGYSLEDYTEETHGVQRDILNVVADICGMAPEDIVLGIDGCSVPVHGLPLYNMALGYARLSNPEGLAPEVAQACRRIFNAMNLHPEMVAGTEGFCTELMRHTNGKLVGKLGAEGVYCIGFRGRDMGLAIKIEDGNYSRALNPAVMRCLEDLGVLTSEEIKALEPFRETVNCNGLGTPVGSIRPAFHLEL